METEKFNGIAMIIIINLKKNITFSPFKLIF